MEAEAVPLVIEHRRWSALVAICLSVLMIVLNSTIVNVTLPFIRQELRLTEAFSSWVMNAYFIAFSAFLLIAGRLGDLYGQRRLFLSGNAVFTVASLGCALATTPVLLIGSRALQGLAGAVVAATALGLIMNLFTGAERSKALGFYGFVSYGGGVAGLLVGGLVTNALNWHWSFFVNVPIGTAAYLLCASLLPRASVGSRVERRVSAPLFPLGLFRLRSFSFAMMVSILWSAAVQTWYFTLPLYLQGTLGSTPAQVALVFLPSHSLMALLSLTLAPVLVVRFGPRVPLSVGLALAAIALALLARAPIDGSIVRDVLPSMILLGFAMGIALNALLTAAISDVTSSQSGTASGLLNSASVLGQVLGLAVAASLNSYEIGFFAGAIEAAAAAATAAAVLRS
jgi:MFS family permease